MSLNHVFCSLVICGLIVCIVFGIIGPYWGWAPDNGLCLGVPNWAARRHGLHPDHRGFVVPGGHHVVALADERREAVVPSDVSPYNPQNQNLVIDLRHRFWRTIGGDLNSDALNAEFLRYHLENPIQNDPLGPLGPNGLIGPQGPDGNLGPRDQLEPRDHLVPRVPVSDESASESHLHLFRHGPKKYISNNYLSGSYVVAVIGMSLQLFASLLMFADVAFVRSRKDDELRVYDVKRPQVATIVKRVN